MIFTNNDHLCMNINLKRIQNIPNYIFCNLQLWRVKLYVMIKTQTML